MSVIPMIHLLRILGLRVFCSGVFLLLCIDGSLAVVGSRSPQDAIQTVQPLCHREWKTELRGTTGTKESGPTKLGSVEAGEKNYFFTVN